MTNKYIKHAKISEAKFKELIKYFALDLDGLQMAELSGLNRNTVSRYVNLVRKRIAEYCESNLPPRPSMAELSTIADNNLYLDDDYNDSGVVFGLFRSNDKIHTEMVDQNYKIQFRDIVRGISPWEAVDYSIKCGYQFDGLVEVGKNKHFRLNQTGNKLSGKLTHLNSIKSFWSFAQMRLLKFRGVASTAFYLHLKECEFRFNHRNDNLYARVLDLVKHRPL